MPGKRLYTDKEFSAIIRRATELQGETGTFDTRGLSMAELEQIAEEAGISADLIKQAALELEHDGTDKGSRLLGGPTNIDLEWMVDGEMSKTKWEAALGEIRRSFAAEGETRKEGHTWDWVHRDQMGARMHVSLSPVGNQTRVRISYGMTEWLWLHVISVCIGLGPVGAQYALLHFGALAETGIAVLILLAFYTFGWLAFRNFARRQDRKAKKLLARLGFLLDDAHLREAEQVESVADTQADRIDPSLLTDDVPADAPDVPRRERERR